MFWGRSDVISGFISCVHSLCSVVQSSNVDLEVIIVSSCLFCTKYYNQTKRSPNRTDHGISNKYK
jgi:hypothetical protein